MPTELPQRQTPGGKATSRRAWLAFLIAPVILLLALSAVLGHGTVSASSVAAVLQAAESLDPCEEAGTCSVREAP